MSTTIQIGDIVPYRRVPVGAKFLASKRARVPFTRSCGPESSRSTAGCSETCLFGAAFMVRIVELPVAPTVTARGGREGKTT